MSHHVELGFYIQLDIGTVSTPMQEEHHAAPGTQLVKGDLTIKPLHKIISLFPSHSRLQFLIACSRLQFCILQKLEAGTAWERG